MKNILLVSEDISKLAIMADKINDMNPRTEIFDVRTQTEATVEISKATHELLNRIQFLEQQVSELSVRKNFKTKGNYRTPRSRSSSRSRAPYNPNGKYCYFHFKFGNKCKPEKCQAPCQWKTHTNQNQEN